MELGNYTEAENSLKAIESYNDFDYFIRLAKWNDHLGDLPTAINIHGKSYKASRNITKIKHYKFGHTLI